MARARGGRGGATDCWRRRSLLRRCRGRPWRRRRRQRLSPRRRVQDADVAGAKRKRRRRRRLVLASRHRDDDRLEDVEGGRRRSPRRLFLLLLKASLLPSDVRVLARPLLPPFSRRLPLGRGVLLQIGVGRERGALAILQREVSHRRRGIDGGGDFRLRLLDGLRKVSRRLRVRSQRRRVGDEDGFGSCMKATVDAGGGFLDVNLLHLDVSRIETELVGAHS